MIKYNPEIKLTNSTWTSYVSDYYPSIFDLSDNPSSSVLICGPNTVDRMWLTGTTRDVLIREATKTNTPAPTAGISEDFVLRLVAISHQPQLSKDLLK